MNGWMNNEWVNNNEWREGAAKLKEALTHTSVLKIAAVRKLHKTNFTNAFQKLLHCFSYSLARLAVNQSRCLSLTYFQS